VEQRAIDYVIILAYLILIALWGFYQGGKQTNVKDYFLGSTKVPWYVVCFSIVAAETSTLTFISIPGLAYLTNLNFLQLTVGYLIGRIFVAYFFYSVHKKVTDFFKFHAICKQNFHKYYKRYIISGEYINRLLPQTPI